MLRSQHNRSHARALSIPYPSGSLFCYIDRRIIRRSRCFSVTPFFIQICVHAKMKKHTILAFYHCPLSLGGLRFSLSKTGTRIRHCYQTKDKNHLTNAHLFFHSRKNKVYCKVLILFFPQRIKIRVSFYRIRYFFLRELLSMRNTSFLCFRKSFLLHLI